MARERSPRERESFEFPTGKPISRLLPRLLAHMQHAFGLRPDLVIASWKEVIGERLAPMTEALSFAEGILVVKVKNATLYSLLVQHERERLLAALRTKFPGAEIRGIRFRLG